LLALLLAILKKYCNINISSAPAKGVVRVERSMGSNPIFSATYREQFFTVSGIFLFILTFILILSAIFAQFAIIKTNQIVQNDGLRRIIVTWAHKILFCL
jgi:hypothetical protein